KQQNFSSYEYDVVIIGGGIIGTAIAKITKTKIKDARVALIEKEQDLGQHQTSHNSNVIHSGFYYEPNSLKAKLCAKGADLIYEYCSRKNISTKKCGKLVIASNILDIYRLNKLYSYGLKNKVPGLTILRNWKEVLEIQPYCKGLQALWSPNTGIVDWKIVTKHFAKDFKHQGGDVFLNCEVKAIKKSMLASHPIIIEATRVKCFFAKYVVTCLGLNSGTLLCWDKNNGLKNISLKINYQLLNPKLSRFVKTNIYAMPHTDMPFIGIHFSPTPDGNVLLGPSAVPALKLDGYGKNEIDFHYIQNHIFTKGFGLLCLKNFRSCLSQATQVIFEDVQTKMLRTYLPMISKSDVFPGPHALQGQVVTHDGEFVDDFLIEVFEDDKKSIKRRIINCRFLPSPGATSSLAIAHMVTDEIAKVYFE
ncbi:L-2-hydroxyglutarate dehydrogenase, mitochondrial-like, partial [Asbolus verrucosus]